MKPSKGQAVRGRVKRNEAKNQVDKRVVTGMANSLRTQILVILNERAASATEISRELGVAFNKVNYEMSALKRANLIERIAEERVRGTVAAYYQATSQAYIDPSEWPVVADPVKGGLRASLFELLMADAAMAISEEAYDSLEGAHMSWMPMIVDEQGWDELTEVLLRAMNEAIKIREDSKDRLIARDAAGISCTVFDAWLSLG